MSFIDKLNVIEEYIDRTQDENAKTALEMLCEALLDVEADIERLKAFRYQ